MRIIVALTFLGLVLNMVITVDPGSAGLTAPSVHRDALTPLIHVETVPMATAAAVARAAGTVSSAVAGIGSTSSVPRPSTVTPQALTSLAAPPASTTGSVTSAPAATTTLPVTAAVTIDPHAAGSVADDESVLSRVGASLTALASGLIPAVPPVLPITTMRHSTAEATSSSGFSGTDDGPGPAVLVLVGVCLCAAFSARRVTDDRARLAWSFVAPLLRPG